MRYLTAFLLCVLFVSCQVSQQALKVPVERSHTFNASFDKTWTTLIRVLSDEAYPFKIMEKGSGILQTDNMSLDVATMEAYSTTKSSAGATYRNNSGTINLKFFVQSKDSSTTTVQITPYMQGVFFVYKVIANVDEIHVLESNGTLEKRLFDKMGATLRGTKPTV